MEYNTQRKKMELPEYGRSVQNMVDHALTIEDREERQRCANTIVNIMGGMFPHLRDVPDFKHKLWDHLAIMADFKLDTGLISFRMDWLDLFAVQGTLKSLLQHHSSKASIWRSAFFMVQLSHPYMTTGNHSFD